MPFERPSITDLLDTHHLLVDRHRRRFVELLADGAGLDAASMRVIIADVESERRITVVICLA